MFNQNLQQCKTNLHARQEQNVFQYHSFAHSNLPAHFLPTVRLFVIISQLSFLLSGRLIYA